MNFLLILYFSVHNNHFIAKHTRRDIKEKIYQRVKESVTKLRLRGVSDEEIRARIVILIKEAYAEVVVAQTLAGMANDTRQIPPADLLLAHLPR